MAQPDTAADDSSVARQTTTTPADMPPVGGAYARYVLFVLVVVYAMNFIDRQILAILAEDIKRDLGLSDSDLGFLYGTAFAVFYAMFGIPLGRLADNWVRVRLLSLGLFVWSGMTALSGLSTNFLQLSAARVGVGIGEASAGPAAYSMLSDWFPKGQRATALAIYSSGLYLGGGVSFFIGAVVVKAWNATWPVGGPLGLVGWQAAFLAVGIPGLLLALLVATLKEPIRGQAEGLPPPPPVHGIGRKLWTDLSSVIPPLTFFHLAALGGRVLATNIAVAAGFVALAWLLITLTGDTPQWVALGLGGYAIASWAQSLRAHDPPAFALIWGTPTFLLTIMAFGTMSFVGYSVGFWVVPYAIRTFVVPMTAAGGDLPWYATTQAVALIVGGWAAAGGFLGTIGGGFLADWAKKRHPSGRIAVASLATLVPAPFMAAMFTTDSLLAFLLLNIPLAFGSVWLGIAGATVQDLVMPRMRGAASATLFLSTTLVGLGLGPYFTGFISRTSGDLATGVLALLFMAPVTLACLWLVYRSLPAAEASRIARAQAAGEII
ncbi:spinster family MFS transporter [Polymorphobacter sp.]|uniref:spinster family MFS transporter n=1 Tax=Polymorphobacter sp. TaxID=1909290 RepID=UPI003F711760